MCSTYMHTLGSVFSTLTKNDRSLFNGIAKRTLSSTVNR